MQDKIAIVLTGTIVPNSVLTAYLDPETRRKEYLQAIHFYTQFAPVYFLENSTYPLDEDKEFTSIPNLFIRKMPVSLFYEKGKGYQEFEMIDKWLEEEKDPPLKWFKISGRYVFQNFDSVLDECLKDDKHELVIDQLFHHSFANTAMFCITTRYYLQHFKNAYRVCDDITGNFIEIVLFKKLINNRDDSIRLFKNVRRVTMISGSTGSKINNIGVTYYLKVIARRINKLSSDRYILYPIKLSFKELSRSLSYYVKGLA
jgi:hypothetical protein